MKRQLWLLLVLIPAFSIAQIKANDVEKPILIGQAKNHSNNLWAELMYYKPEAGKDTTYILFFQNQEYESITDLQKLVFTGNATLADLYSILNAFFLPENISNKDYSKSFELGKDNILAMNYTVGKKTSVMIVALKKGKLKLNKKELDSLFGKK